MEIEVDVRSAVPAYEQIRAQVTTLVLTGQLAPGTRLPPIRQLAGHLGLSNGAVARAYRELEREDTVITAGKRGTVVADVERTGGDQDDRHHRDRAQALREAAAAYATTARALGFGPAESHAALAAVLPRTDSPPSPSTAGELR